MLKLLPLISGKRNFGYTAAAPKKVRKTARNLLRNKGRRLYIEKIYCEKKACFRIAKK